MTRSAEARGATVDEAVQRALAELGVAEEEATVEVLSEGRRGLFAGGRRAHVRVTAQELPGQASAPPVAASPSGGDPSFDEEDSVSDTEATHDDDREDDLAGAAATTTRETEPQAASAVGSQPEPQAASAVGSQPEPQAGPDAARAPAHEELTAEELTPEERMNQLDEEAELAADFVEGLLDRFDLPGDLEIEVHEDQAFVNLLDVESGILIGRRGATLDALQELVRSAVQRQTERRAHVRIDVEGYKARQTEKLRDKCREAIAQVRETGEPYRLEPMDPYERKLMHGLVAKTGGVTSVSEGHEPKRRVVIHPEA